MVAPAKFEWPIDHMADFVGHDALDVVLTAARFADEYNGCAVRVDVGV